MNILMIGNGFDLAHGLLTKYTDFLEWVKIIKKVGESLKWVAEIPDEENKMIVWVNDHRYPRHWKIDFDTLLMDEFFESLELAGYVFGDDQFSNMILSDVEKNSSETMLRVFNCICKETKPIYEKIRIKLKDEAENRGNNKKNKEIYYLLKNNVWIDHFLKNRTYTKENWIDFENEIASVIESIDRSMRSLHKGSHQMHEINNHYISQYFSEYNEISLVEIAGKLYSDLNKVIRLLEIYLSEYAVAENDSIKKILIIENIRPDKVLCFNYTDTYQKIYQMNSNIEFDYIHGKANINRSMEKNNMVLGIDEYLPDDRKNKDIDFLVFRKFYQRIYKGTGNNYKRWVDKIKEDMNVIAKTNVGNTSYINSGRYHNLFIFGHSLDMTDNDVLRDFILNDNVQTKIYYPTKEDLSRKIVNLVKVIGQEELIRRTGGSTKTIEFISI